MTQSNARMPDRLLMEALMSAYSALHGLRADLASSPGFKEAVDKGFLAILESPDLVALVLTEAGKTELAARTTGLPLPLIDHLFTRIPVLSSAPFFDLHTNEGLEGTRMWVEHTWLKIERLAVLDSDPSRLAGYWNDDRAGIKRPCWFQLPENADFAHLLGPSVASTHIGETLARYMKEPPLKGDHFPFPASPAEAASFHRREEEEHQRSFRSTWGLMLDSGTRDMNGPATFLSALASEDISVFSDICQDMPNEVCVRANGKDVDGGYWSDLSILLLGPHWDQTLGPPSQALADTIVEEWDELRKIHASQLAAPPPRHEMAPG